ncbi:MAG: hypothetical protein MJ192_03750 [Clostridia bacterium]|nr:hypothetical protein [Clostridia bacterium]
MYTEQQKQASKYYQHWMTARIDLLLVFVLSALNIIMIPLTDRYFTFATYISDILLGTFWTIRMEEGVMIPYIFGAILTLILIAVFLVLFFVSKKHWGAMLAGTILYGLDTLLLIMDMVSVFVTGEALAGLSFLGMLVWHACGMFIFISALIKCRTAPINPALIQKEEAEEAAAATGIGILSVNEDGTISETTENLGTRQLTVTRPKNFVGCAIPFSMSIDGEQLFLLKNGKSETLTVTAGACRLEGHTGNGIASSVDIPAGTEDLSYEVSMKMGMWANEFVFTRK